MARQELTQKQELFCLAYIETGNASEAYRRAYNTAKMKPETINEAASRLIADRKVTTRIGELRQAVAVKVARSRVALIPDDGRLAGQARLLDGRRPHGQHGEARAKVDRAAAL